MMFEINKSFQMPEDVTVFPIRHKY